MGVRNRIVKVKEKKLAIVARQRQPPILTQGRLTGGKDDSLEDMMSVTHEVAGASGYAELNFEI